LAFYNNISKYIGKVFGGFYNITYLIIGANNNIIIYKN
jgi:hypothetical protein